MGLKTLEQGGLSYDKSFVMLLKLVQTPVGSIRRHEETKAPFVHSTIILLVECWSNKRLENKPAPKVDTGLEYVTWTVTSIKIEYLPINAILAIIPRLVERRSPRIRISIVIIRIVRIGPPYEKKAELATSKSRHRKESCAAR